jgi:hypothetical protein
MLSGSYVLSVNVKLSSRALKRVVAVWGCCDKLASSLNLIAF